MSYSKLSNPTSVCHGPFAYANIMCQKKRPVAAFFDLTVFPAIVVTAKPKDVGEAGAEASSSFA
jgi:hypothetical protein